MPIAGLVLHFALALFCAVHAVRSGQPLYWLLILFTFPLLGSLVYFFVIYLPNSRLQHGAIKAVSAAGRALDPEKELRAARADFEVAPTAQNQMRLAAALLDLGQAEESARLYEGCLKGPFAADPNLRYDAARAFVECRRYVDALGHLEEIRKTNPTFRAESVALLLARCYAGMGRTQEAREAFEQAVTRYGSFEARAEYAIWAWTAGDTETAKRLQADLDNTMSRWTAANRKINEPILRRVSAARCGG